MKQSSDLQNDYEDQMQMETYYNYKILNEMLLWLQLHKNKWLQHNNVFVRGINM